MKILFITEYFPADEKLDTHGGVETRTFYLAKFLSQKHQVNIIASKENNKPKFQQIKNIIIFRVGLTRSYSRKGQIFSRLIFMFSAIITSIKINFDLVEGTGFFGWFPAAVVGFLKNRPKVLFVPDLVNNYTSDIPFMISKILYLMQNIIFSIRWNKVIVISKSVGNRIRRLYPNVSYTLIYCGVDVNNIKQLKVTKYKNKTICTVSRLVPYKRVIDLIYAIGNIKQQISNIRCVIIGDGEEKENLQAITRKLNLESNIKFLGYLSNHEQVIKEIKRCYIFCLPSVVEGFGIVTIEAFASRLPAVLANIKVNKEITQRKGVLFFNPRDSYDLSKKLIKLYESKTIYAQLANEAIIVAARYNWDKLNLQTQVLYENLYNN